MSEFVDLHCHCIPAVDDGVRSADEARELLRGLGELGFGQVVATPHMRPGLFDTDAEQLRTAFDAIATALQAEPGVPRLGLACEHFFDDVVFERVLGGRGLPYPGERAVLFEFGERFPLGLERLLSQVRRHGLLPVIAHPERYRAVWQDTGELERLLDVGAAALLDTAALVGKYGKQAKRCAHELLERGLYQAACSDTHRPSDVALVRDGMALIEKKYGSAELQQLFKDGPNAILQGRVRW